jgi:hypothetical protein
MRIDTKQPAVYHGSAINAWCFALIGGYQPMANVADFSKISDIRSRPR